MFTPKTDKIKVLANLRPNVITKLEAVFAQPTAVYIDYANVRPWSTKLGWHIELKRLKQFLDSFDTVKSVSLYNGYLKNDPNAQKEIYDINRLGYTLQTKPVKIMRLKIDARRIVPTSTELLRQFISPALLRRYTSPTIKYLNGCFVDMNRRGEYFIEERKCNFDVEMAVDMLLESEKGKTQNFILWSGDSDFYDPLRRILKSNRNAVVFGTAGRISAELNELKKEGLFIFDIFDIKDFICWRKEITP